MNTWKLTIKPDNESSHDPFVFCRDNDLLGVGWSEAYEYKQASNIEEAKKIMLEAYEEWPYAVRKLLEEVEENDHVWLHYDGEYFLCRVKSEILIGSAISPNFLKYDLGHARKADWVMVPEMFVSGAVQRGTIAQRMIQKIYLSAEDEKCHQILFDHLTSNPDWVPDINQDTLSEKISNTNIHQLFTIMTPDDIEDIIATYLQDNGWFIIKSTCFRSKPVFEFTMMNKNHEICHVQVKSGTDPDPLPPEYYKKYVTEKKIIYLFSTNSNPYPGNSIRGINCLTHEQVFTWLKNNAWAITEHLKLKLWMYLCEH